MRQKVIIDTDLGDDIDDAFAICLALKSPEIEILGITTVFCDVVKRAKMVKALLAAAGEKKIPVYAGESKPINNPMMFGKKVILDSVPVSYSEKYENCQIDGTEGVKFIIETLEREESVTIITLGALTNIAKVITIRPDLMPKISKVCIMGGAFLINHSEYNFCCDPEAADIVINSGLKTDCVGIDITLKCFPTDGQMELLMKSQNPCIKLLLEMRGKWKHAIFFHDPLAVMCAFDESFVTFNRRVCRVENKGEFTRGIVVNVSDYNWQISPDKSNLRVGVEVNANGFVQKCMDRLLSF